MARGGKGNTMMAPRNDARGKKCKPQKHDLHKVPDRSPPKHTKKSSQAQDNTTAGIIPLYAQFMEHFLLLQALGHTYTDTDGVPGRDTAPVAPPAAPVPATGTAGAAPLPTGSTANVPATGAAAAAPLPAGSTVDAPATSTATDDNNALLPAVAPPTLATSPPTSSTPAAPPATPPTPLRTHTRRAQSAPGHTGEAAAEALPLHAPATPPLTPSASSISSSSSDESEFDSDCESPGGKAAAAPLAAATPGTYLLLAPAGTDYSSEAGERDMEEVAEEEEKGEVASKPIKRRWWSSLKKFLPSCFGPMQ